MTLHYTLSLSLSVCFLHYTKPEAVSLDILSFCPLISWLNKSSINRVSLGSEVLSDNHYLNGGSRLTFSSCTIFLASSCESPGIISFSYVSVRRVAHHPHDPVIVRWQWWWDVECVYSRSKLDLVTKERRKYEKGMTVWQIPHFDPIFDRVITKRMFY